MSAPRVLMVIQRFRPQFTGHGIQIETMARELTVQGARVEILTRARPDAPLVEPGEVPVRRFSMTPTRNPVQLWWSHRKLLQYVGGQEGCFDILHLHGAPPAFPLLIGAARHAGLRTVITTTLMGSDDPLTVRGHGRMAWWRFRAYRRADRYVAICPALADLFPPAGISADRVAHIPVGVSVERFRPAADPEAEARALGWETGAPRALFVGGIRPRKGVDVLLDAWEHVLRELPEARLYLAGPTEYGSGIAPGDRDFVDRCLKRAGEPPLGGRVFFLGLQEDPAPLYRAAHVFVFPTRKEGFPNVLLETIASGTPAITTRLPGSTDVSVRDGETGYVVEQEDAAGLAQRTVALLRDGERRRAFAEAARRDAEQRYAFPIVARTHLDLYRDLLERGPEDGEG